MSYVNI